MIARVVYCTYHFSLKILAILHVFARLVYCCTAHSRHGALEACLSFVHSGHLRYSTTIICLACFCREVVASLIEEYKACESPNYINWGMGEGGAAAGAEGAGAAAAVAQGGKDTASAT